MAYYETACRFCNETVEPGQAFFAFRDVTFYAGDCTEAGEPFGAHIADDDPEGPDRTVHEKCWASYWSGIDAGKYHYGIEE